jgi:hypothetical protein
MVGQPEMVAQDEAASERTEILTPDQRLRVFVSSTLNELAEERGAARRAIERLCLAPVMFELGARPHPPRALYLAYLRQSHVFVGIYGDQYGWTAPEMEMSGLEDELRHATRLPMLIYIRRDASRRDPRLTAMIDDVAQTAGVSYKTYSSANELESLLASDLAVLLTERFAVPLVQPAAMTVPRPASEFVGRRAELAELAELITRDTVRLVTLTGPGGIGKTRLALELAYTVADRFADGAVFVPLAALGPDDLIEAISMGVGLKDLGEQPLMELVVEGLRDRRLLLVLDNFEHLASAAGQLAGLLERTRTIRALVTSRTALRLTGEEEFLVPPLGVPRIDDCVDDVLRAEAAQLFCRRVAAIRRGYRLSEDDAATVVRICRRLDGLPLALELVAARANVMSVQQLGARLGMVLDLSSRSPDVPARQRTLRQTMDWSFSQLPPTARTALPQLGVFIGSFTLDAAEAVCEAGTSTFSIRLPSWSITVSSARTSTRNERVSPCWNWSASTRVRGFRVRRRSRQPDATRSTTGTSPERPTRRCVEPTSAESSKTSRWTYRTSVWRWVGFCRWAGGRRQPTSVGGCGASTGCGARSPKGGDGYRKCLRLRVSYRRFNAHGFSPVTPISRAGNVTSTRRDLRHWRHSTSPTKQATLSSGSSFTSCCSSFPEPPGTVAKPGPPRPRQ